MCKTVPYIHSNLVWTSALLFSSHWFSSVFFHWLSPQTVSTFAFDVGRGSWFINFFRRGGWPWLRATMRLRAVRMTINWDACRRGPKGYRRNPLAVGCRWWEATAKLGCSRMHEIEYPYEMGMVILTTTKCSWNISTSFQKDGISRSPTLLLHFGSEFAQTI